MFDVDWRRLSLQVFSPTFECSHLEQVYAPFPICGWVMHFQFCLNTSEPLMGTAAAGEDLEQTFTVVSSPTKVGIIHRLHR